jgi:pilus assembly protein Flp/PilA
MLPSLIRLLARDRKAVTALEYGLIASLISVVIIKSVTALGADISSTFSLISSKL